MQFFRLNVFFKLDELMSRVFCNWNMLKHPRCLETHLEICKVLCWMVKIYLYFRCTCTKQHAGWWQKLTPWKHKDYCRKVSCDNGLLTKKKVSTHQLIIVWRYLFTGTVLRIIWICNVRMHIKLVFLISEDGSEIETLRAVLQDKR
jgi:hypothetical protein